MFDDSVCVCVCDRYESHITDVVKQILGAEAQLFRGTRRLEPSSCGNIIDQASEPDMRTIYNDPP